MEDVGVRNGVMVMGCNGDRIQDLRREWEWKIVKVVSAWLPPFEVRELALYREEWERSLLTDWPQIWKVVEKLKIGLDKNLKSSWKLKIEWDKKIWKAVESLGLEWDSRS